MGHTQGPWRVARKYDEVDTDCWWLANAIVGDGGTKICWMSVDSTDGDENLLAAAPDLLAALENLKIYVHGQRLEWESNNPGREYNPFRLKLEYEASAAIQKAKGVQ